MEEKNGHLWNKVDNSFEDKAVPQVPGYTINQCCGTAGTATFCLRGIGTLRHSGSGFGFGSGIWIQIHHKMVYKSHESQRIKNEMTTSWEKY
jgi:hypothetical protein